MTEASRANSISIYYSRGDGTFYQGTVIDAGQEPGALAAGDFNGRVARPLDHSDATNKVGAPLFAFCAKGGRDAACSADFDIAQVQYYKQHHTRPCQQRKDGAPTVIDRVGSSKAGPPAQFSRELRRPAGSGTKGSPARPL